MTHSGFGSENYDVLFRSIMRTGKKIPALERMSEFSQGITKKSRQIGYASLTLQSNAFGSREQSLVIERLNEIKWISEENTRKSLSSIIFRAPLGYLNGGLIDGAYIKGTAFYASVNSEVIFEVEHKKKSSQKFIIGRVAWKCKLRPHQNKFGLPQYHDEVLETYFGRWDENRKYLSQSQIWLHGLPIMRPVGQFDCYENLLKFCGNCFNIANACDIPNPWEQALELT